MIASFFQPRFIIIFTSLFFLNTSFVEAETRITGLVNNVEICEVQEAQIYIPNFLAKDCWTTSAQHINPRNTHIWVKVNIALQKKQGPQGQALALYITSKMAAEFYLNGEYIGHNGSPSHRKKDETPGNLDSVIFLKQSLLIQGENELIFRASSHHDWLKIANSITSIEFRPSGNITPNLLSYYSLSLLLLGVFILGSLYFGLTGFLNKKRKPERILCLISFFAAAQLIAEVYRGFVAYPYPVQDVRLILITLFSMGFGLAVAFYVLITFKIKKLWITMSGITLACFVGMVLFSDFDDKSHVAIITPLIASLIFTGYFGYQGHRRAILFFFALLSFILALLISPLLFLDVIFFYLVAAFLFVLFIEQGIMLNRESTAKLLATIKADRLELALSQAQERNVTSQVIIKSAGKIQRISVDKISHCSGADGYTAVNLVCGSQLLHNATLTQLEEELPPTFLRVHRSHLVNTSFVQQLKRDASGTGNLTLADGSIIPVSRRIMPQVREIIG
jgi:hypothetical protein